MQLSDIGWEWGDLRSQVSAGCFAKPTPSGRSCGLASNYAIDVESFLDFFCYLIRAKTQDLRFPWRTDTYREVLYNP